MPPVIQMQDPLTALNTAAEGYVAGRERVNAESDKANQIAQDRADKKQSQQNFDSEQRLRQQANDRAQHAADTDEQATKINNTAASLTSRYSDALSGLVDDTAGKIERHIFSSNDPQAIAMHVQNTVKDAQKSWALTGEDAVIRTGARQAGLNDQQTNDLVAQIHAKFITDINQRVKDAFADYAKQNPTPKPMTQYEGAELNLRRDEFGLAQRRADLTEQRNNTTDRRQQALLDIAIRRLDDQERGAGAGQFGKLSPGAQRVYEQFNTGKITQKQALGLLKKIGTPADQAALSPLLVAEPGGVTKPGTDTSTSKANAISAFRKAKGYDQLPGELQTGISDKLGKGATAAGEIQSLQGSITAATNDMKTPEAQADPSRVEYDKQQIESFNRAIGVLKSMPQQTSMVTGGSNGANPFSPPGAQSTA